MELDGVKSISAESEGRTHATGRANPPTDGRWARQDGEGKVDGARTTLWAGSERKTERRRSHEVTSAAPIAAAGFTNAWVRLTGTHEPPRVWTRAAAAAACYESCQGADACCSGFADGYWSSEPRAPVSRGLFWTKPRSLVALGTVLATCENATSTLYVHLFSWLLYRQIDTVWDGLQWLLLDPIICPGPAVLHNNQGFKLSLRGCRRRCTEECQGLCLKLRLIMSVVSLLRPVINLHWGGSCRFAYM